MTDPRGRRAVAVAVALLLLLATALGGSAAPATDPEPFVPEQVDADSVLMRAELGADGGANWTVEYRMQLDDADAERAFESLQSDVQRNPGNFTERFGARMRETARTAENATGREMSISDVSVSADVRSLPQGEYGVVTYTFRWTNFAVVDGDAVRAGDALAGLFLEEGTRFELRWPAGYELDRATPDPSTTGGRSASWAGLSPVVLGGAAAGLLAVAGVALWARRGGRVPGLGDDSPGPAPAEGDGQPGDGAAEPNEPPAELLSNEEQVLRFVERQGGRVKQQEVVQGLDWTEAKTSQVVRQLRDEGKLEGFRLGRENVLRLPDADDDPQGGTDEPS